MDWFLPFGFPLSDSLHCCFNRVMENPCLLLWNIPCLNDFIRKSFRRSLSYLHVKSRSLDSLRSSCDNRYKNDNGRQTIQVKRKNLWHKQHKSNINPCPCNLYGRLCRRNRLSIKIHLPSNPNIPCNNLHCPIHYLTNRRKNGRKSTLYQTTLCTILRRYNPNRHRRKNTHRTHRILKRI